MESPFGVCYKMSALSEVISRARIQVLHLEGQLDKKVAAKKSLQRQAAQGKKIDGGDWIGAEIDKMDSEIETIMGIRDTYLTFIQTKYRERSALKEVQMKACFTQLAVC